MRVFYIEYHISSINYFLFLEFVRTRIAVSFIDTCNMKETFFKKANLQINFIRMIHKKKSIRESS